MPVLSNAKHELYAQERAKGASQDAAYKAAGYKPDRSHAARLASNGLIAARVEELLTKAALTTVSDIAITRELVTENLVRIATNAELMSEDYGPSGLSVARSSWMDAAKLNGLIVEKSIGLSVTAPLEEFLARIGR